MNTFLQDLRYGLRMLGRRPVFTATAVLTLALGIGLNTAVFSAIDATLLRPLPGAADPDRLVLLFRDRPGIPWGSSSVPYFQDMRDRTSDVFDGVAAWTFVPLNLSAEGQTERVMGQMVSANFFDVLGAPRQHGRTFLPEEAVGPGAHPVVVLSDAFWQRRFGGDSAVVGQHIVINGRTFTVVGVARPEFRGALSMAVPDLWAPLMMATELMPGAPDRIEQRGSSFLQVIARLRPGVTAAQARSALVAMNQRLGEEHPGENDNVGVRIVPQSEAGIHPSFRSAQVGMSAVIMAVVAMLLLIACLNVANLFLVRAAERRQEMAIRLSIGAGRRRILRQLLTESLVFAVVAGAAGLGLAWTLVRAASSIRLPVDIPIDFGLRLDATAVLYASLVTLAATLVFGLVPALRASRPALIGALKGETRSVAGGRSRLSRALVVAQLALSVLLLAGAGMFLQNLRAATRMDVGFDRDNLLLAAVDPGLQNYDRPQTELFYERLLERVRAMPGVTAAALGEEVPLGTGSQQTGISVPGYDPAPTEQMSIDYNIVGADYFGTMGIPVVRGRGISEVDGADATGAIVVNQNMADRFWPNRDPIGRVVQIGSRERLVVGVVADGKYRRLGEDPLDFMYLPQAQSFNYAMTLHVRTTGDPARLVPLIRDEVRALDPDLPISDLRTMESHLGTAMLPARLAGWLLAGFGLLGLVLAAVGIYGVMANSVAQRTREIGIRVALGADRREIVRMVLGQGALLTGIGLVLGIGGALAATRAIRGILYSGGAPDPVTFVGVPLLLAAVALFATWMPARRAAEVQPVDALNS